MTTAPEPDTEPDNDADDQPVPVPPITTANVAPVLLPPNIA